MQRSMNAEARTVWQASRSPMPINVRSCRNAKRCVLSWCTVPAQVLQDAVKRVDRAYDDFFRRVGNGEEPGYPRFKSH